jgi:2-dehydro-3-deoxy-L-rhamnonate dehydrogenase (NAD+)
VFEAMTQAHSAFMLSKVPLGRLPEINETAAMAAWLSSAECSCAPCVVFDLPDGRATV